MSTDDSVSEDVSTSGALSHGHVGEPGKESEASLVSSEGTSTSRTAREAAESRTMDISPACSKIRSLVLSSEEALEQQKNLPFINPSSLETLRALVQEIQSSGETDPEIWKDCQGRWLHLFQLVEKQYQEQILAQQEQYQCQIQLIQDEIKALVQLQNRQASVPTPETKPPADLFPLVSALQAPFNAAFSFPSPPPSRHGPEADRHTATVLSSGYGTLSTWESTGLEPTGSPGDEEEEEEEEEEEFTSQRNRTINPAGHQQKPSSSSSQQLTSWSQRTRLRPRRTPPRPDRDQEQPRSLNPPPQRHADQDQDQLTVAGTSRGFNLRRSDSLMSEASGLTYWRLNECDLYRPLPDSFDSGASLLLQEASFNLAPSQEPRLSLREIYQNKQRGDGQRSDWDRAATSGPAGLQVLTVDSAANTRQSERTSGFTSPSHFSSPSFALRPGTPDCVSDTSSTSAAGPPPWGRSQEEGSLKPRPPPLDDPLLLSLLRQNLREKHSRHVADLKAYYENEIQTLRDRLKLREDFHTSNQQLVQRCKHLEEALSEATSRVQVLEAANSSLEKKLAERLERYGAAITSLQQHLEESKQSGREKDGLVASLRTRIQQLEEEVQTSRREAEEKEARMEREDKKLQDKYGSLKMEHEETKNKLLSTENKLLDANDHISELKRLISKLESQMKQIEHENQARPRFSSHNNSQPSGPGLFHHPDLLLSPSKGQMEPDVTRRKSSCPPPLHQNPPPAHRRMATPSNHPSSGTGSPLDTSLAGGSWRCVSPPDLEKQLLPVSGLQEQSQRSAAVLTPVMRALIELEETRATQSRAPWVGSPRTTVGLVERRHMESVQERVGLFQVEREVEVNPGGGRGAASRRSGLGRPAALLRAQRSLSPEGTRSSSLPPQRNLVPHTPTKRETLLAPLSAKSSPKRCPTENFSTAFGHPMPREEHLLSRVDPHADRRRHSFTSSSPRKKLQFSSERERDDVRLPGREEPGGPELQEEEEEEEEEEDSTPLLLNRPQSLSEAEKLFDQLTQEKLQVEAALSRLPASGGRVTLQTRLDEVAFEKRLERLNRELGSLRRTLKMFHILRSSTNT